MAHLEHLQTVLQEFDANAVILELVLIRLFRNGFKPSIRSQAKQKGCQKDIWDQAIKKAITVEGKTALNFPLWVRKMDACCPQGHCSILKPTKDHIKDRSSLLFCLQEAHIIPPHCFKQAETLKKPR